jgi:hypothetical protein
MLAESVRNSSLVVASILTPLAVATATAALDCPTPQALAQPGVIQQTADQIEAFSSVFGGGEIDAQVRRAIDALRKRYPNAQAAELTNYLITAYCPTVKKLSGLTDAEKTARVRAFADRVLKLLY